jgi:SAM-dependent methyltransferase
MIAALLALALAGGAAPSAAPPAQTTQAPTRRPDVIYVPTPQNVVDAMLELAGVKPGDVVYDLGCGDGRLVVSAARLGARGVGVDIDLPRVNEARANVKRHGVEDRVRIVHADLFLTDIREATVVTLFLLPELNVRLRPKLWKELKPGTRVVSHLFDMGDWKPDRKITINENNDVYLWTIPPDAARRAAAEEGDVKPE